MTNTVFPTRSLVDCGKILSGGTPSKARPEYWDGIIPWFSSKEVKSFELAESELHVSAAGIENGAPLVPPGTVLFVVRGMSLANEFRVGLTTTQATFNQDVKGLIPAPDVDGRYLARCLRWLEPQVLGATEESSHGTKRLSGRVFETLPIPIPTIREQRRIADILDKADAILRRRKEAIALVDALFRSTFLEMFGDPVRNPKGWKIAKLGDLAEDLRYGTSEKCGSTETSGALPVLRIPNVTKGAVDWTELKYATLSSAESARLALQPGDILFVRSNGNPELIGRCAVFNSQRRALFASYLIRARIREGMQLAVYLKGVFSAHSYRQVLTGEARTTAGNFNISAEALRQLSVPVPPHDLVEKYFAVDAAIQRQLELNIQAHAVSGELFESLVAGAFSGEDARC